MVLATICLHCLDNQKDVRSFAEVQSELYAISFCPAKHATISMLSHDLFDILYKSAVDAFLKNFFSESVMSFTATLERLYERFIKVHALKSGVSLDVVDKFWNEIKNQSERQYGAFCFSYAQVANDSWNSNTNKIAFRNKVIHKGYIATSKEVVDYATYITECLTELMFIIKNQFSAEQKKMYEHEKSMAAPIIEKVLIDNPGARVCYTSTPSLLGWNCQNYTKISFNKVLEMAKYQIKRYGYIR